MEPIAARRFERQSLQSLPDRKLGEGDEERNRQLRQLFVSNRLPYQGIDARFDCLQEFVQTMDLAPIGGGFVQPQRAAAIEGIDLVDEP